MKKITIKQIRKLNPCYDPTEIKGITENTKMTLLECMEYKADKLSNEDKVWLFANLGSNLDRRIFAIWCARQCKTKNKEIKHYIDVIEKYYIFKTATKKELEEADWLASESARYLAYRSADYSANRSAYSSAGWSAYESANRSAYRLTRKKQVKKIIQLLKESE